jgi:hypothetical protein
MYITRKVCDKSGDNEESVDHWINKSLPGMIAHMNPETFLTQMNSPLLFIDARQELDTVR